MRHGLKIVSYYVVDNEPLIMSLASIASSIFDAQMLESSFDLMQNPLFSMQKRNWMMPTPFILNDAVVINNVLNRSTHRFRATSYPTIQPKKSKQNY
jgi:hypothetical protein